MRFNDAKIQKKENIQGNNLIKFEKIQGKIIIKKENIQGNKCKYSLRICIS